VRVARGSSSSSGEFWLLLSLSCVSVVLTLAIYAPTLHYGLYYDDYHFVRPYAAAEIAQTFHDRWDPSGIETAYYRPLTICLYAARFAVLGLNATAAHAMSLGMFAVAAILFGMFVARISASRAAGIIAAAVFIVHPGMPYSAVTWITNQMHLAAMIVMFAAFLWWFAVRRRGAGWWMLLLVFQAAAFLIKEDGIMLLPAIALLHVVRKLITERDLPNIPPAFAAAAVLVLGSLLLVRASALHGVPSPRLPSLDQAWTNWVRGLSTFRLLPAKRPWQAEASWFVTLVPLLALLSWRRLTPGLRGALVSAPLAGLLFDLPFAFIVKAEQLHLVSAAAAMLTAAAIAGLLHVLRPWRILQAGWVIAAALGLVAMGAVARDISRDFEPYGRSTLRTDRIVQEWAAVPVEVRDYLARKAAADPTARPDSDPSRALPLVAFGLHGAERSPDGRLLRWMAAAASDVFVRHGTRLVTFAVRHEIGAFREPAHVRIEADGRTVSDVTLSDDRWAEVNVPLRQRAWTGAASGMHHIRIRLDHAWIPSQAIPGSTDTRTLGLQVGDFQLR
jgi:hypothetical protein